MAAVPCGAGVCVAGADGRGAGVCRPAGCVCALAVSAAKAARAKAAKVLRIAFMIFTVLLLT